MHLSKKKNKIKIKKSRDEITLRKFDSRESVNEARMPSYLAMAC